MRQERHTASQSADAKPRRATRKWIVWLGAMIVLFVVVVAYETQQQLRDAGGLPARHEEAASPAEAQSAAAAIHLAEYYRSHDLPRGWHLADIRPAGQESVDVSIVFSPGIQDPRHGQLAPEEDVTAERLCPKGPGIWQQLAGSEVTIRVGDKRDTFASLVCPPEG